MEHKPVIDVAKEQVFIEHARLSEHRPRLYPALHDVALALFFMRGVIVEGGNEQRIAHSAPGVQIVAVTVKRHGRAMDELGLIRAGIDTVGDVLRAQPIAFIARLGVFVRMRGDDRRQIDDVVRAAHKLIAVLDMRDIAENGTHAALCAPLCPREKSLLLSSVQEQQPQLVHALERFELLHDRRTHVTAAARDRNDNAHNTPRFFHFERAFPFSSFIMAGVSCELMTTFLQFSYPKATPVEHILSKNIKYV